jgi:hypothetical protein
MNIGMSGDEVGSQLLKSAVTMRVLGILDHHCSTAVSLSA